MERNKVETSKEDASKQDAKVDAPVDKTAEAKNQEKIAQLQRRKSRCRSKETTVDTSTAPATEKASTIEKKEAKATTAPKLLEKQQLLKRTRKS